jgi:hypothetical protein
MITGERSYAGGITIVCGITEKICNGAHYCQDRQLDQQNPMNCAGIHCRNEIAIFFFFLWFIRVELATL